MILMGKSGQDAYNAWCIASAPPPPYVAKLFNSIGPDRAARHDAKTSHAAGSCRAARYDPPCTKPSFFRVIRGVRDLCKQARLLLFPVDILCSIYSIEIEINYLQISV